MSREAMKQPEALRWANILEHQAKHDGPTDYKHKAAAELRRLHEVNQTYHEKVIPKREWFGLTDEQVEDEWERITGHSIFGGDRSEGRAMYISPDEVIEFSRAIEAKLKEKNHG